MDLRLDLHPAITMDLRTLRFQNDGMGSFCRPQGFHKHASGIHRARYTGWWASIPTPLKNDGVKVNWDDEIPNINGKIENGNQTTNQMNLPCDLWIGQFMCITQGWIHGEYTTLMRNINPRNITTSFGGPS